MREGKRPLDRLKGRLEGNIKTNLEETGWKGVDWVHLAENRDKWRDFVNTAMNLWVLQYAENIRS
jgi:hypothetical protein